MLVTAGGVALIGAFALFFFGPKQAGRAEVRGGVQEVGITVKGGYSPSVIKVQEGVPLRLIFDRRERGGFTSEVVFPDPDPAQPPGLRPNGGRSHARAERRVRVRVWDEHGSRNAAR